MIIQVYIIDDVLFDEGRQVDEHEFDEDLIECKTISDDICQNLSLRMLIGVKVIL